MESILRMTRVYVYLCLCMCVGGWVVGERITAHMTCANVTVPFSTFEN